MVQDRGRDRRKPGEQGPTRNSDPVGSGCLNDFPNPRALSQSVAAKRALFLSLQNGFGRAARQAGQKYTADRGIQQRQDTTDANLEHGSAATIKPENNCWAAVAPN